MELEVRGAFACDRDFCYNLMRDHDMRFWGPIRGWDDKKQRAVFDAIFDDTESDVITADGDRVGFAHVETGEDSVEISELHVTPSMRGKGIGAFYIRQIVAKAGDKPVYIDVFKKNTDAYRLYERLGFKRDGESEHHIRMKIAGGSLPEFDVPTAGNAFMEAGGVNFKRRINKDGIACLRHGDVAAVYFRLCESGSLSVSLACEPEDKDRHVTFSDGKTTAAALISAGASTSEPVTFIVSERGYFRIQLTTKDELRHIGRLHISGLSADGFVHDWDRDNYYWTRRGPSVHLSYTTPDAPVEWFYNELTVPAGMDPVGTYAMAVGFSHGYFGIQVNGVRERRVLFSVWSPHATDDPTTIPEDKRVKLLCKNDRVSAQDFGGEGSGGQSYMRCSWKAGETYKFLIHAQPFDDAAKTTVFTAFFKAPDDGDWQLVASFARPMTGTYIEHPYSFLENFSDVNGYLPRRAEFGNAYAITVDGEFIPADKALLTGDATLNAYNRRDGDGGACDRGFFLQNGGFIDSDAKFRAIYESGGCFKKPQLNFNALLKRTGIEEWL